MTLLLVLLLFVGVGQSSRLLPCLKLLFATRLADLELLGSLLFSLPISPEELWDSRCVLPHEFWDLTWVPVLAEKAFTLWAFSLASCCYFKMN